jgi:hypothetical protein
MATQIHAWAAAQPAHAVTIEVYLAGTPIPQPGEALFTVAKEHTQIAVRTAP